MKQASLQALLIDHAFGELSPEVAELLDAYLESDPAAKQEAAKLRQTLAVAERALRLHPELVRQAAREEARQAEAPPRRLPARWLQAAAALVAATGLGILLGREHYSNQSPARASATEVAPSPERPTAKAPLLGWTQFRLKPDSATGRLVPAPIR